MTCPVCNGATKVVDSRKNSDHIVRYRQCKTCGYRFRTIETDEDIFDRVVKGKGLNKGEEDD